MLNYKNACRISWGLAVIAVIMLFLYDQTEMFYHMYFVVGAFILVVLSLIIGIMFVRCPHCGKVLYFELRVISLKHCPNCGSQLIDYEK